MRVVFMGSADFGIPTLEAVLAEGHEVAGIVTTPARPKGRGREVVESPVARHARELNLGPVCCPEDLRDPSFVSWLRSRQADVFVVVAYRLLPEEVFGLPPHGTVNVHASLLPRYRGSAPIHRAIEAGERETGITVFLIDFGVDTGGILVQRATPIGENETTPEVYARLAVLGAEALLEALGQIESGSAVPVPQDGSSGTKAPRLCKEEARIDWQASARLLYNRVRAFKPFPGTYCVHGDTRLGVEWAQVVDDDAVHGVPGTIAAVSDDSWDVACGRGLLRVLEVKPAGRKRMSAGAYMRGAEGIAKGAVLQ